MSHTLGISFIPSFKYSANKYAQEYYNACKELRTVQYGIDNCSDAKDLKALLDKKEYLEEHKLPNLTNKVEKEQTRLELFNNNDTGQHKINYLA